MSKSTVAVIDYGMGNLHSVASALQYTGEPVTVKITSSVQDILAADRVVFPGVGAIRDCMAAIRRLSIDEVLHKIIPHKPVLAICVGMQALMTHSEENDGVDCLGLLPGTVKFFGNPCSNKPHSARETLKIPHMGWNQAHQTANHPLWAGIPQDSYFYFAHSYYVSAAQKSMVAATVDYGVRFDGALQSGYCFATQCHPEKSGLTGIRLLTNFLRWEQT